MQSIYRKIDKPRDRVKQGPFAGMRYVPFLHVTVPPKIYGTYELELRGIVDEICRSNADLLVNIGAAEGYYSVGFARCKPDLKIVCFEMSEEVRDDLRRQIQANGVSDRIEVRGRCDLDNLPIVLQAAKHPVVLCDVEGFEMDLLDPRRVPALLQSTMLVELHEHERPGLSEAIRQRFSAFHVIQTIQSRPRTRADLPPIHGTLSDEEFHFATAEHRGREQEWFYMVPRPTS